MVRRDVHREHGIELLGVSACLREGGPFAEAKARGAKLIVIDPRFTDLAAKADIWLQLKPGTDGALALGFMNVLINEELYDKDFVDKWTVGFDCLAERAKEFPPERVAEITWLKPEQIIHPFGAVKMIRMVTCDPLRAGYRACSAEAPKSGPAISLRW